MATITSRSPRRMARRLVGAAFASVGLLAVPAMAGLPADASSNVPSIDAPSTASVASARGLTIRFQPETVRYEKGGGGKVSGKIG